MKKLIKNIKKIFPLEMRSLYVNCNKAFFGTGLCLAKRYSIVLREVDLGGVYSSLPCLQGRVQGGVQHKKSAFTLAEVLITIGIIGIIAAMTMPSIINAYNKKTAEVRLKKFYSIMNQTVQRLTIDYGDVSGLRDTYTISHQYDKNNNLVNKSEQIVERFKEYFGKYIEFVKEESVGNDTLFYFKDGSAIMVTWYNNYDYYFFPKNPKKCLEKSGTDGICMFRFQLNPSSDYNYSFSPYVTNSKGKSDEDIYNNCKNSGIYCTLLICRNGWNIPKNYPRKLAL